MIHVRLLAAKNLALWRRQVQSFRMRLFVSRVLGGADEDKPTWDTVVAETPHQMSLSAMRKLVTGTGRLSPTVVRHVAGLWYVRQSLEDLRAANRQVLAPAPDLSVPLDEPQPRAKVTRQPKRPLEARLREFKQQQLVKRGKLMSLEQLHHQRERLFRYNVATSWSIYTRTRGKPDERNAFLWSIWQRCCDLIPPDMPPVAAKELVRVRRAGMDCLERLAPVGTVACPVPRWY